MSEQMSKSAAKKAAKEAKKAAAKEAKRLAEEQRMAAAAAAEADEAAKYADRFGVLPVIQSTDADLKLREERKYLSLSEILFHEQQHQAAGGGGGENAAGGATSSTERGAGGPLSADTDVWVRARVHSTRAQGNMTFVVLRQRGITMQAVVCKGEQVPKVLVKFAAGLSSESVVAARGRLAVMDAPVLGATIQLREMQIDQLFVVSTAAAVKPIQVADAATPQPLLDAQDREVARIREQLAAVDDTAEDADKQKAALVAAEEAAKEHRRVEFKQRFDNRCLDLRTPANQALFRLKGAVCALFREFLVDQGFTEIHSPKLLGAKSEGGANVFEVDYFNSKAYLAQSPQFYKQMAICSDFQRVFEVAPVFRAENSQTKRHMTEFVGLDLEMEFSHHYHEVLDLLDRLFRHVFEGLVSRHATEIAAVAQQYPVEKRQFVWPSPLIPFPEAAQMLEAAGHKQTLDTDLSTENERVLGQLVKEKYGSDFFRLDKFPTGNKPEFVRAFYTLLDPKDPSLTNSYDFILCGQELMSGAQRIHDADMLRERASEHGVDLESIAGYLDAFKYGCPPHAGGGIGLERVVSLFLGLDNCQMTSLWPRTPHRLFP